MEGQSHTDAVVAAIIALALGIVGGYYLAASRGGATPESEAVAAQQELADLVNPFSEEEPNPVESGYRNPFRTVNPFGE